MYGDEVSEVVQQTDYNIKWNEIRLLAESQDSSLQPLSQNMTDNLTVLKGACVYLNTFLQERLKGDGILPSVSSSRTCEC